MSVRVQQGEGAVGQGVAVPLGAARRPRGQQPVQALELRQVQSVLALQVGDAAPPRRRLRCGHRADVAPVQTDKMFRLDGNNRAAYNRRAKLFQGKIIKACILLR